MTLVVGMTLAAPAFAHPLAPALLELRAQGGDRYEVLWRTSVVQVAGREVRPQLPCEALTPARRTVRDNEAVEERWQARCDELAGQAIAVSGLAGSGINVVLRIVDAGGRVTSGLLDLRQPRFTVSPRSSRGQVLAEYFSLGVGHLLSGFDHLLFVLGLLVLVRGLKPLLLTITAFTLGHSLTLAAATLGLVRVNPALTELGIAISLIVVALAILRPQGQPSLMQRHPASLTLSFGLLHGLGFAGALSAIGLPADEIPLSLLGFNLGIEAGQLLLVVAALSATRLARRWLALTQTRLTHAVPAYIIGSLAACWCIERTIVLLG